MKKAAFAPAAWLLAACAAALFADETVRVPVSIHVPSFISFTSDQASFTLRFADVFKGAETDTATVRYTVTANQVQRDEDVIQAKLSSEFPAIDLLADFVGYQDAGGDATLVESAPGFITILTSETALADKRTLSGKGRRLSGSFDVSYKARAARDLEAGTHTRTLSITIVDT